VAEPGIDVPRLLVVAASGGRVSAKADIWMLGVMLAEIIAGPSASVVQFLPLSVTEPPLALRNYPCRLPVLQPSVVRCVAGRQCLSSARA
jgi:hypothetical protein